MILKGLIVICDSKGLNEKRYEGVPPLIVEILGPSKQHQDLIVKMNLYSRFGVKEYWIVDPMNQSISIYVLDESGHYVQGAVKTNGTLHAKAFDELYVDLDELFDF